MSRREEKAAATRRQLLDAAFQCLYEVGYHGTTTVAVCERAGLARGTMLHHFPNKQSLMLATLDDVLGRRVSAFQEKLHGVDTRDLASLIQQLWAAVKGPTFWAWLELAVAARTDPVLANEFRAVMKRFESLVVAVVDGSLSPEIAMGYDLQLGVSLVFSTLNGLALDLVQVEEEVVEEKVKLLIAWLSERSISGNK